MRLLQKGLSGEETAKVLLCEQHQALNCGFYEYKKSAAGAALNCLCKTIR